MRTYPEAALRVSDADRDAVLAELSDHYQAGRLTSDELDDRSGRALRARTGADLAELLADLPAAGAGEDRGADRRRRRGTVTVVLVAVAVAAAISIAVSAGTAGHVRIDFFPWWLVVAGFFFWRRRTRW